MQSEEMQTLLDGNYWMATTVQDLAGWLSRPMSGIVCIGAHSLSASIHMLHYRRSSTSSSPQHSTAQHGTARHGTAQHSTAQHSTAQHSTAQHSTAHTQENWSKWKGHTRCGRPAVKTAAQVPAPPWCMTPLQSGSSRLWAIDSAAASRTGFSSGCCVASFAACNSGFHPPAARMP